MQNKTESAGQSWQYHQQKPTAGRKLKLLEAEELLVALPLIYRLISLIEVEKRKDWFYEFEEAVEREQLYILLTESLSSLNQLRKQATGVDEALLQTNLLLNRYFSDYGWRMVRKELSQIKKRKKKSHIEIGNDLVVKLKEFMAQNQIDTFDQAIDHLLSEYPKATEEF
ncbi:hypothetical protein L2719_03700 [Shewanella schlegeliana]|uniref:Uncharacterized protein n=1 Tax=Shewanella schlegeliana TaxID=190308 RepID=A0ABS1SZK3_9GAMM|nr:hypothetical protein [Shewanella schlegeliana]MBL4913958.1 hypothetical protein [Shewanella schlegeliana]MCL1108658.1 hypothetical protein [Shewanella schlegeliana]GIU38314.1 hypothetical protein TUM4433_39790 [Shewanella schlegeliana]